MQMKSAKKNFSPVKQCHTFGPNGLEHNTIK